MSVRKISRLTDAEIVARYQAGESRTLIALRAKVPDYHVEAVLIASGVRLRGPGEALRMARARSVPRASTERAKARGRSGWGTA